MDRFYFFRLKLVNKRDQKTLFELDRGKLLLEIIKLRPSAYVRKGIEWIMANTEEIDDKSVFFKFGRLTTKSRDKYDPTHRLFIETEDDIVESTKCLYDSFNQVLAIEKCSATPLPTTLAKYIMYIINNFSEGPLFQYLKKDEQNFFKLCRCQVDPIPNPIDFIEHLSSAFKITEFDVTFFRKNPFDFNEMLEKPLQNFLEETDGETSTAGVRSEEGLKSQPLIELTHAAAATGSDASARVQKTPELRSEKIQLKSKFNIANIDIEEVHAKNKQELIQLLNALRDKYKSIRGVEDE
ncbi:hypothetical protein DesfrDRAFT_1203 [Solidesulfovibrio fructosivorans JJ]]|uniref:Uncharacterized protein n=1 Tax=Solidesulfovibrio fructosivorans JJ] TaxID=596151 RepID=E1JUA4_SOLFR|nr:hypothetical protein [Solidesulfovibrio fructosivorans]EFL52034.1 hypothetical protein DesfrDRAFT_1203 [Solidesulfovibrio fructosivorans JJ]]